MDADILHKLRGQYIDKKLDTLQNRLEAIADRIEEWQRTYDVQSPEELEATLAGDRPADGIQERHRALRRWENSRRSREIIKTTLRLYDDVESLTDDVPGDVRLEGMG